MRELFEYSDALNSPVEAFVYDTEKNEFPVQSHWHYFAELIFMIKGHAVITCNSQRHELNPSEMLFIQPQVIHSIYSADNEPLQYFVVKFDMGRLSHPNSYIPKFNALFMYAAKDLSIPVKFTQENFGTFSLTEFFTKCIREVSENNTAMTPTLNVKFLCCFWKY